MKENIKYCAIICEFNPFHNGHAHIIAQAKKLTGLPVLCLMSGNFCQRSEAACLEKRIRAQHAIKAGASIVLELPVCYATGSANTFAKGAIEILKNLPVTHLVFGSECGDLSLLLQAKELSKSLNNNANVRTELKKGQNYKTATRMAASQANTSLSEIFEKPNNMLAVEYLKALEGTNITPITIKREDNYLSSGVEFSSSTQIREDIKADRTPTGIPSYVVSDLESFKNDSTIKEHLFFALKLASTQKLSTLFSVSEGLEHRIAKTAAQANTFDQFLENAVTKRYSRTRLRRIALENFFGITKEKMQEIQNSTQTTTLLAKAEGTNFDGFFEKQINLVLKKSDKTKYSQTPSLAIDITAEKLYSR